MTVKHLIKLLREYADEFTVTIENNHIKVVGMYPSGDLFKEFINSSGGVWEGGCGTAPNGKWCGECATFNCDECGWEKRDVN
jgi:hypothetical protein